uniref:Uncharacterized protein n=1 Tax=Arundo donax TaxID=35708 RepID=A0A0A9ADY7_ARUDO
MIILEMNMISKTEPSERKHVDIGRITIIQIGNTNTQSLYVSFGTCIIIIYVYSI